MKFERNIHDEESRRFWEFVDAATRKVAQWPEWMRGGPFPGPPSDDDNRDERVCRVVP